MEINFADFIFLLETSKRICRPMYLIHSTSYPYKPDCTPNSAMMTIIMMMICSLNGRVKVALVFSLQNIKKESAFPSDDIITVILCVHTNIANISIDLYANFTKNTCNTCACVCINECIALKN